MVQQVISRTLQSGISTGSVIPVNQYRGRSPYFSAVWCSNEYVPLDTDNSMPVSMTNNGDNTVVIDSESRTVYEYNKSGRIKSNTLDDPGQIISLIRESSSYYLITNNNNGEIKAFNYNKNYTRDDSNDFYIIENVSDLPTVMNENVYHYNNEYYKWTTKSFRLNRGSNDDNGDGDEDTGYVSGRETSRDNFGRLSGTDDLPFTIDELFWDENENEITMRFRSSYNPSVIKINGDGFSRTLSRRMIGRQVQNDFYTTRRIINLYQKSNDMPSPPSGGTLSNGEYTENPAGWTDYDSLPAGSEKIWLAYAVAADSRIVDNWVVEEISSEKTYTNGFYEYYTDYTSDPFPSDYTLSIEYWGVRSASEVNSQPIDGVWDGNRIMILNRNRKVFSYKKMGTEGYVSQTNETFELNSNNSSPIGITWKSSSYHILDSSGTVFVYKQTSGDNEPNRIVSYSNSYKLPYEKNNLQGIGYNGIGIQILDDNKIYELDPLEKSVNEFFNSNSDKTRLSTNDKDNFSVFENGGRLYLGLEGRFDLAAFYAASGNCKDLKWEYILISNPEYRDMNEKPERYSIPTAYSSEINDPQWEEFYPKYDYLFDGSGAEAFERLYNWKPTVINNGVDNVARYWIRVGKRDEAFDSFKIRKIEVRPIAAYCTPEDVASLLQISNFRYTDKTVPTREEVEDIINSVQSLIDSRTYKSWRLNYIDEENYEFKGRGFNLLHRDAREVLNLSIWNGEEYETKRQGRNEEYELIKDLGRVIYTRFFFLPARLHLYVSTRLRLLGFGEFTYAVKVKYLYGKYIDTDTKFGGLVFDITRKLAASTLLVSYDSSILSVSGADRVSLEAKSRIWKEESENNLDMIRGWMVL